MALSNLHLDKWIIKIMIIHNPFNLWAPNNILFDFYSKYIVENEDISIYYSVYCI